TEFGALVKVQETEGGIVTEIAVVDGKNDAPLLVPAVEGHDRVFGRPPGLVAVDRGFYSTDGERRVWALGVRHAVIPKPGFRSRLRAPTHEDFTVRCRTFAPPCSLGTGDLTLRRRLPPLSEQEGSPPDDPPLHHPGQDRAS